MGTATLAQTSFNGGEISPRLKARVDQQVYSVSLQAMVGYYPLLQGPAVAMTGTRYVEKAKGACRLFGFEYSPTEGYVIEASAETFRFYTNDVRIETSPGVAYQVSHPYSLAELEKLSDEQSFDVKYLVGAGKAPRVLVRTGATTFQLNLMNLRNGPIGESNTDEGVTVGVGATTGSTQLFASAAIFVPTDVGSYFELEAADYNDIPSWEPGIETAIGAKCTWGGKVYQATAKAGATGRTGSAAPIHDTGEEWDGSVNGTDINAKGPYGIKWRFLHGRIGLARITGYTSPSIVQATVVKPFASSLVTTGSWRWAFGAFSDTRGWPDAVKIWGECLVLFKDNVAYVSVVADLENFERRDSSGDFQRDLAGQFSLPNNDRVCWAVDDRQLVIGTDRAEYTVERVLTQGAGAGPPVFMVKLQGTTGADSQKPIQASGRILFVQRARRKVHELAYAFSTDRYNAPNVARLADHLAAKGIVATAFAQEPLQTAWWLMEDGTLAGMTYDPDQQVIGWFQRPLADGLTAKSICRITDPQGIHDQIWLSVESGANNWVVRMEKPWEFADDPALVNFMDAALSYHGAPVSSGGGAGHLAGKTVQVLADGKPHRPIVIGAGGSWALDYAAGDITLGLEYPAYIDLLPWGSLQGDAGAKVRIRRVKELTLQLLESQGLAVTVQGHAIDINLFGADQPMDEPLALFTGDKPVSSVGTFDRESKVTVRRSQPMPSTLLGVIARVETE